MITLMAIDGDDYDYINSNTYMISDTDNTGIYCYADDRQVIPIIMTLMSNIDAVTSH